MHGTGAENTRLEDDEYDAWRGQWRIEKWSRPVQRLLKCVARTEQVEGRETDSRLYDYVDYTTKVQICSTKGLLQDWRGNL